MCQIILGKGSAEPERLRNRTTSDCTRTLSVTSCLFCFILWETRKNWPICVKSSWICKPLLRMTDGLASTEQRFIKAVIVSGTNKTRYATSRSSGWHSCFVFGKSRFKISGQEKKYPDFFMVFLCLQILGQYLTSPNVAVGSPLFLFGRSWVQISGRRSAILTEGIRGFPRSLQANAGTVRCFKLGLERFLPYLFQFIIH
jgi:hypothetical protein